jgi:hypothetical protein
MHDTHHRSHDAPPLSPRYYHSLAAGAAVGNTSLIIFMLTQIDPALRVTTDARFTIVIWCMTLAWTAGICWLLHPHGAHLAYALRLGRAHGALPAPPDTEPRRGLPARRWVWAACGTTGACVWTLAAAVDIASGAGRVDLYHANLDLTTLLLCQFGAACEIVRILGPSLAAVDDVYRAARVYARDGGGTVVQMRRPAG